MWAQILCSLVLCFQSATTDFQKIVDIGERVQLRHELQKAEKAALLRATKSDRESLRIMAVHVLVSAQLERCVTATEVQRTIEGIMGKVGPGEAGILTREYVLSLGPLPVAPTTANQWQSLLKVGISANTYPPGERAFVKECLKGTSDSVRFYIGYLLVRKKGADPATKREILTSIKAASRGASSEGRRFWQFVRTSVEARNP